MIDGPQGLRLYASLGIPLPVYTGGAVTSPPAPGATSEAQLDAVRSMDARHAQQALGACSAPELLRLCTEMEGMAHRLSREIGALPVSLPDALMDVSGVDAQRQLSSSRVHAATLVMLNMQRAQVAALHRLAQAALRERHGRPMPDEVPSLAEAERWLELRIGQKNAAEAEHECLCMQAAQLTAPPGESKAMFVRLERAARQNVTAQCEAAQQEALTRTRDGVDALIRTSFLGMDRHMQRTPSGVLSVLPNMGANPRAVAQALDLLQVRQLCEELLGCYRQSPAELRAARRSSGVHFFREDVPCSCGGKIAELMEDWQGHLALARILNHFRTVYLPHADTFNRAHEVMSQGGFAALPAAVRQKAEALFLWLGLYAPMNYCIAVDQAWGIRDVADEPPAHELLATTDSRFLMQMEDFMAEVAAGLGAVDTDTFAAGEFELVQALTRAVADIFGQLARWQDAPSLVATLLRNAEGYQPIDKETTCPPGTTHRQWRVDSVLRQHTPYLVTLPSPPPDDLRL